MDLAQASSTAACPDRDETADARNEEAGSAAGGTIRVGVVRRSCGCPESVSRLAVGRSLAAGPEKGRLPCLPPLAEKFFHCVVLDEVSGSSQVVIEIGEAEAFWRAATLQNLEFGRPMTYHFAAALLDSLGGRVREVQVDRLVEGAYAAMVEIDGPLGMQSVDARASDALNLAALTGAPVFVSSQVADDADRRLEGDSAEARLLRVAPTVESMRITREKP